MTAIDLITGPDGPGGPEDAGGPVLGMFGDDRSPGWRAAWRHPMAALLARRLLQGAITLIIVSIVVFTATEVLPGNAAYAVLGHTATPARVAALERQLNLNRPAVVQYWLWLTGMLRGGLGKSLANNHPVASLLGQQMGNSSALLAGGAIVGTVIGVLGGAVAATRRDRVFDHVSSVITLAVTALPEFIVAIAMILLLSLKVWHVLPAVSLVQPGQSAWTQPRLLILPVITLTIVVVPYIFRMARSALVAALESDAVEMARLKGVRPGRILFVHALPAAAAPLIHVIGLNLCYLAGGIVVVEYIFNFPGIGQGLVNAVSNRDIPSIQATVLVLAAFYIVVNIATDLIALAASPRHRSRA
jgi:peptide/nickel transport system permease protein